MFCKIGDQDTRRSTGQGGMILPLAAIFAFTGVMIVAFALFVSAFSATRQQVEAGARLMALAAVQGYAETTCPDPQDIAACDQVKREGALQRARRVLAANDRVFTGFKLSFSSSNLDRDNQSKEEQKGASGDGINAGMIELGRYAFSEPEQDPKCPEYPCFYLLDGDELANSVRISGQVFNSGTNRLLNSFGFSWARPIPFQITAAQVPIRLVVMMDLSGSMAEDTHLPPSEDLQDQGGSGPKYHDKYNFSDQVSSVQPVTSTPISNIQDYGTAPGSNGIDQGSVPALDAQENHNYFEYGADGTSGGLVTGQELEGVGDVGGTIIGGGKAFGAEQEEIEPEIESSFFAFPIEELEDPPTIIPEEAEIVWEHMQQTRPADGPYNPAQHFRSDYLQIRSIGVGPGAYESYEFKHLHPEPGRLGLIWEPKGEEMLDQYNKDLFYLVDSYRNAAAGMNGPEPFLSAIQGIDEVVKALRARQVAGDKIALVFYDTQVYWNYVVNLTDNFDYIESLIDPDAIMNAPTGDFPETQQPWLRLGHFAAGGDWTHVERGLLESAFQLAVLNDDGIPAVNEIVAFGDGLTTCSEFSGGGMVRCESNYEVYKESMDWITNFASTFLFYNKISLHVVQVGEQVGPHFLGLASYDKTKGSTCMTDETARKEGISLVRGQEDEIINDWYGQNLYGNRFNVPFFQAAYDWYRLAVITGGVYAPVRPAGSVCPHPMLANDCGGLPENDKGIGAERITTDPHCRSAAQQVSEALKGILKGSVARSYAIVDSGHGIR